MEVGVNEGSGSETDVPEGTEPATDSESVTEKKTEESSAEQTSGEVKLRENDIQSSTETDRNPEEKLCGWLSQRTRGIGNFKLHRQRWFTYGEENCKLYFYHDPTDFVPLGEICIATASFCFDVANADRPGLFKIKSEGKDYHLDAGNRRNMMDWLQALQQKRKQYSLQRPSAGVLSAKRNTSHGGLVSKTGQREKAVSFSSQESIPHIQVSEASGISPSLSSSNRSATWALTNLKTELQQVISTIKITGRGTKEDSVFYADQVSEKGSISTVIECDQMSNTSSSSNQSSLTDLRSPANYVTDSAIGQMMEKPPPKEELSESDQLVPGLVKCDGTGVQPVSDNLRGSTLSESWTVIDKEQVKPEVNQSMSKVNEAANEKPALESSVKKTIPDTSTDTVKSQGRFMNTFKKIRIGKRQNSEPGLRVQRNSTNSAVCPKCKTPVPITAVGPPPTNGQDDDQRSGKTVDDLEEELTANRDIVSMLQIKLDETLKELISREQSETADEREKTTMLVEKDKLLVDLKQQLNVMKDELRTTTDKLRTTEVELKSTEEQASMYQDMLTAKDEVIMGLTNELFENDKVQSQVEEEVSENVAENIESTKPDRVSIVNESEVEKMKDMCQGYELQHKFLIKEILELSDLRKNDQAREQKVTMELAKMQAKYYQVKSKYYVLLKQMKAERSQQRESTGEPKTEGVVEQLLQDALESEADESEDVEFKMTTSGEEYDRYGFSRKDGFHGNYEVDEDDVLASKAVILERQSQELNAKVLGANQEASWRVKWENFMVTRGNKIQRSQELKSLIRHGIPHEYRADVWKGLVALQVGITREKYGPMYYSNAVKRRLQATTLDPAVKQIELDLLRTLPNNKHYSTMDSEGVPALRKVLLAFSDYNISIGYCQGLNRLAAIALLFLSEEDAFWCLVAIVDHILPQDYFSHTLMAAQADQRVLKDVLHEKLPKVFAHLELHGVDLSLFTFNWFLTIFVDNIPPEMFMRVWDSFLYEGSKVLFRFAVAFLKKVEDEILKQGNSLELNRYLRRIGESMTDVGAIAEIAFHWLNPFPMRLIALKRQQHLEDIKVELVELEQMRYGMKVKREEAISDYCTDEDELDS